MKLKEIGNNTRNWVDSAQDRGYSRALVITALDLWVPCSMELVNTCSVRVLQGYYNKLRPTLLYEIARVFKIKSA